MILATLVISRIGLANDDIKIKDSHDDLKWASDLSNNSTVMVWQNLKEQFEKQRMLEMNERFSTSADNVMKRSFAGLYIFVSTSMSKPLLSQYLAEASKYGGVLVLKGLPNGSFRELIKLVIELTKGDEALANNVNLQIDDEAFEKFDVNSVPAIVVSREGEYHPNQSSDVLYDKVTGNVGIKFALEQFASKGELQVEASDYLHATQAK